MNYRQHISKKNSTNSDTSRHAPSRQNPLQTRAGITQIEMDDNVADIPPAIEYRQQDFSQIPVRRTDALPILAYQTKLTIGEPGNKYEQEADRIAAQVVNQINAPVSQQPNQNLQREEISEEDELQKKSETNTIQREDMPEEELQMKPMLQLQASVGGMAATSDLETSIQQARGGGQSLADNIRQPMEQAFGADFSGVKVHTDRQSDQLNRSIQARAFTTGHDVFFGQGEYNPGRQDGQRLLAHELTHVVQQNGGAVQQVMTFQYTQGNSSVGSLIQRVSKNGTKKVKKMPEGDVLLGKLSAWQAEGILLDKDVDLLIKLGNENLLTAITMDAKLFKRKNYQQIKDIIEGTSSQTSEAKSSAPAEKKPREEAIEMLESRDISKMDATNFMKVNTASHILPWLNKTDQAIVKNTVAASIKAKVSLAELDNLLKLGKNYGWDANILLQSVSTKDYQTVKDVLSAANKDDNIEFLKLWILYEVSHNSSAQLKQLTRFQARLKNGAKLTVHQIDQPYISSKKPPSRTGFLQYNFGKEVMEIHTHWNENDKKIVSMHVQDNNKNGIEINHWPFFGEVAKAVLDAHNTSMLKPTTRPPNQSLTL